MLVRGVALTFEVADEDVFVLGSTDHRRARARALLQADDSVPPTPDPEPIP
jgi:hypothetical protein